MFNWPEGWRVPVPGARRKLVLRVITAISILSVPAIFWAQGSATYQGIGRAAKPAEIKAWDIDVRPGPDFRGLPPGSGTVSQGQKVWDAKCSSCHGVFGDSNEVFSPIVGGTTQDDIKTGHVKALRDNSYPGRTTFMKLSQITALWDYIHRAMPWTNPKSLSTDEVYAVTAYLLNLADIVPASFTLSQATMAEVQNRLPNRNGMTTAHDMWPGDEFHGTHKPDVQGSNCMRDCATEPKVSSMLPDFAMNSHGNLADQNRLVGPVHGLDTAAAAAPADAAPAGAPAAPQPKAGSVDAATAQALMAKNGCTACHAVGHKVLGPAFKDVASRYKDRSDAAAYLTGKIMSGGQGTWGSIPMPPQALSKDDAQALARWLAEGAPH